MIQNKQKRKREQWEAFWLVVAVGVLFFVLVGCKPAGAEEADIIRAIIGEASGESFEGKVAVACGIHNRPEGLQSVYGANMKRIPYPIEIEIAKNAWRKATPLVCYDLIQGADMWENVKAFGQPKKWPPVIYVNTIGSHNFYRRITEAEK